MFDRNKAIKFGWNQCVIFNHTSSPKVFSCIPEKHKGEDNYYIVLSHPCSLLNYSLVNEPTFEYVIAKPIEKIDGNCTFGKNPRKLHIYIASMGKAFELEQCNRNYVIRDLISDEAPISAIFEPEIARSICLWVANRYLASSFPDEFENRISKAKKNLRKKYSGAVGEKCRSAYLILNEPLLDLESDEDYKLRLFFTLSPDDFQTYDQESDTAQMPFKEFLLSVKKILNELKGISIEQIAYLNENQITLNQIQSPKFKKWNYDFLSVVSNTETDDAF